MVLPVHGLLQRSILLLPVLLLIHLHQLMSVCYNCYNGYCTITTQVTPTFDAADPLCQNSTPLHYHDTSNNGITGTWSPATINTAVTGTTTYTFTPAAGQCATTATMHIVTITTQVTPTFNRDRSTVSEQYAYCITIDTSNNGITGTWTPATINTAVAGTTTYTFTPLLVSVLQLLQWIL